MKTRGRTLEDVPEVLKTRELCRRALMGAFQRRIQWRLGEPSHPYTLRELAEKIGRPSKPSYKRRQRLCTHYAELVEAESRGTLTPEEREELARIQERIAEAEEKAQNRLSKRMSPRGRGGRE
jgi:hypothetical protein